MDVAKRRCVSVTSPRLRVMLRSYLAEYSRIGDGRGRWPETHSRLPIQADTETAEHRRAKIAFPGVSATMLVGQGEAALHAAACIQVTVSTCVSALTFTWGVMSTGADHGGNNASGKVLRVVQAACPSTVAKRDAIVAYVTRRSL